MQMHLWPPHGVLLTLHDDLTWSSVDIVRLVFNQHLHICLLATCQLDIIAYGDVCSSPETGVELSAV